MRTEREHFLDPSIVELLAAKDPLGRVRLNREMLAAVYVLVKNSLIFELNNPALQNACARTAAVANVVREQGDHSGSIAFLADGVYINQSLLKLSGGVFEQSEYLHAVWAELGVGEIETVAETTQADWLELSARLKEAVVTPESQPLRDLKLERIHLTAIDSARHAENVSVSERFRALRAYSLVYLSIDELIRRVATGSRLRVIDVKRAIQQVIDVARSCPDLLMALVHMKRHKLDLAHHLTNTAVLTIVASRELELSRRQRAELAVQAALHDAGNAFALRGASELETAVDWTRRWVEIAPMHYRNLGRLVVANETPRWIAPPGDGDPYRWPLWSASRLVAAAHAYDAMTTPRPDRQALLPDEALRVLTAEAGRRYDRLAVKLLVSELGVYPVGSTVSLSDGRIAIVVEAPRGPAPPRVKIARELDDGQVIDGAVLDLAAEPGLSILGCIEPESAAINTPAFLLG
jgi:HD-GYP domain-containing protein (c-di-GMP phosphodiesterase class II)